MQILPNPILLPGIRSSFDPSVPWGPSPDPEWQILLGLCGTKSFSMWHIAILQMVLKKTSQNNYYVLILILSVCNRCGINWRLFCHMWPWAIITSYSSLIIKLDSFMLLFSLLPWLSYLLTPSQCVCLGSECKMRGCCLWYLKTGWRNTSVYSLKYIYVYTNIRAHTHTHTHTSVP